MAPKRKSWRMCKAVEKLREQINNLFPDRDKESDGGIGDAAHASSNSDHNPWIIDSTGTPVVTARDFDHDPDHNGLDCHKLAKILVKHKDARIKYIIWDGQICSSKKQPWKWRPYVGKNMHRHHLHISITQTGEQVYDDVSPWILDFDTLPSTGEPSPHVSQPKKVLKFGDKGKEVKELQEKLITLKYLKGEADGDFGNLTQLAVKKLQSARGLKADGIAGPATLSQLEAL